MEDKIRYSTSLRSTLELEDTPLDAKHMLNRLLEDLQTEMNSIKGEINTIVSRHPPRELTSCIKIINSSPFNTFNPDICKNPKISQPLLKKKRLADSQDFVKPKKYAPASVHGSSKEAITINNMFSSLSVEENDTNNMDITNDNASQNNSDGNEQPPTLPHQPKIPEITIEHSESFPELMEQIKSVCKTNVSAKLSGTFVRLAPNSQEQYEKIIAVLTQSKTEYFITSHRSTRPLKVVVRGLPINTSLERIEEALTNLGYIVLRIAQMKKYDKEKDIRINMPLFQVHLARNELAKDIKQVKTLLFLDVTIENYKGKGQIAQCHNCQLFNHSSENCKFKARCLKCAEYHRTTDCPHGKRLETPKCAVCNGEGHTANYRLCPMRPKPKPRMDNSYADTLKAALGKSNPLTKLGPKKNISSPKTSPSPLISNTDSSSKHFLPADGPPPPFPTQEGRPSFLTELASLREIAALWKEVTEGIDLRALLTALRAAAPRMRNTSDPIDKAFILSEVLAIF